MSRQAAQQHARRIVASIPDGLLDGLTNEPFVALEGLDFAISLRLEQDIAGDCSVYGTYDLGPPPKITVVQTASVRRQYFTALHEYGHVLILDDGPIHDEFLHQADGGALFEEQVCDAIAAEILLPEALVSEHIGSKGPTARSVIDLFHASHASREACCVRASQRIFGPGHVMLADGEVARFTATTGTPFGVRRGTRQGSGHLVAKAAANGRWRGEGSVVYASGLPSDRFFADAASDDGYVFAVFMESRPAWLEGPTIMTGDRTDAAEAYCTHCEVDFTPYGAPCAKCSGYRHYSDDCGRCACETAGNHRTCQGCFLLRLPSEFTEHDAICDVCLGG